MFYEVAKTENQIMVALFVVRSQFPIFDETSFKMKGAQMYEYFRINFNIFIVEV